MKKIAKSHYILMCKVLKKKMVSKASTCNLLKIVMVKAHATQPTHL